MPMDTYNSALLGERVRRARMARGWKQKDLAENTGVPQGNISRIERGQIQDIHLSRFVALMHTLEVISYYLLGLDPVQQPDREPATSKGSGSKSQRQAKGRAKAKA